MLLPDHGNTDPDTTIPDANASYSLNSSAHLCEITSLKERTIKAKERGSEINTNIAAPTSKDSIGKYSKEVMPKVYYSHPMAAVDHINIDQISNWEELPGGKLLAHPFGHEVKSAVNHQKIKADLFAAVEEITQLKTIGISSPHSYPSASGMPTVFLIYSMTSQNSTAKYFLNRKYGHYLTSHSVSQHLTQPTLTSSLGSLN